MRNTDHGMTILEVVFAITILLIGAGFLAKSNAVSFKYRDQSTEYQQMLFYAVGQMDAALENISVSEGGYTPFNSFTVPPVTRSDVVGLETYLEKVGVQVEAPGRSPVIIYSYRLK